MTTQTTEPIRVERADVRTCCIEVKVVKIDRKQMTLSVFRQIPEEPFFAGRPATQQGKAWGLVRYHGVQLLWQKGKELRRCPLLTRDPGDLEECYGFLAGEPRRHRGHYGRELARPDLEELYEQLLALEQLFIAV